MPSPVFTKERHHCKLREFSSGGVPHHFRKHFFPSFFNFEKILTEIYTTSDFYTDWRNNLFLLNGEDVSESLQEKQIVQFQLLHILNRKYTSFGFTPSRFLEYNDRAGSRYFDRCVIYPCSFDLSISTRRLVVDIAEEVFMLCDSHIWNVWSLTSTTYRVVLVSLPSYGVGNQIAVMEESLCQSTLGIRNPLSITMLQCDSRMYLSVG